MRISELLYVNEVPAPGTEKGTRGILNCATAQQAAEAMKTNHIAIVPTTDIAQDTIRALGYGPLWAAHAIHGRNITQDDMVDFLF